MDLVGDRPEVMVASGYRRGMTIAVIVIIWAWHIVNDLPVVFGSWRRFTPPAVDPVAWLLVSAVGLVATVWLIRPGRLSTLATPTWVLVALLLCADIAVYAACPVSERFSGADWVSGTTGWFAVAVLWYRRGLRDIVLVLAAHALIFSTMIVHDGRVDHDSVGQYLMILYGASSLQLAFAVGYRATVLAATWAATASAATAEVTTRRIIAVSVHKSRQERYNSISDSVRATMAGLASGRLDPGDPETQQRCAIEAARLRRLLAEDDDIPEPLLNEVRAGIDVAERRGVEVEMVSVGRLPRLATQTRRMLADPPITVLASARSRARVTIVALPDEVVVSVLADSDLEPYSREDEADVRVTYQREGFLLWMETRWHGRSESPSSTTIPS